LNQTTTSQHRSVQPRYTTQQHQQQSSQIRLKSEPGNESKIRDCLGDLPEAREADSKKSKNLSRILEKQTLSSPDSIRFDSVRENPKKEREREREEKKEKNSEK
jgi:hypothetical protein